MKQVIKYDDIDKDALNSIYKELLIALEGDEEALMKIFKYMSGQQINLPVHLYSPKAMKRILKNKYQKGIRIDTNQEAIRYGYTRRWILGVIKQIEAGKI